MDLREHWEGIYGARRSDEVSWFQPHADLSRDLIREALVDHDAPILDVGGGASTLADDLLAEAYRNITVLDLASAALSQAHRRLGAAAEQVRWVVGDVLVAPLAQHSIGLWHDRAVFHFLTEPADRARYISEVRRIVRPGGLVLVATFAADGPERCSGLPVSRYAPEELHAEFGGGFQLLTSRREVHHTPAGIAQPFTYCLCRYNPETSARAAA
jgi:ubiquinone/menaquinone biosynthesis C-methylase UbiE